jgi:hypothetical protein
MATKKHTGDVGEHWVLYRLIRAGYTAVLAPTNAKAVDILAANKDGKSFSIQVKTKTNASGWRFTEEAERTVARRLFYCLVDLGRDGNLEPPEVYVLPSEVVARTVRIQHAGWLSGTKASGEPRKDTPMRVLRDPYPPGVGKSALAEYPSGWLGRHKENWDILGSMHRST